MAALSVELSRPSSNTPYQALKPHEYLQSSPIALTVKRKSGLSVTTPLRKKKMRFDIEPTCQDANMDSYQARYRLSEKNESDVADRVYRHDAKHAQGP